MKFGDKSDRERAFSRNGTMGRRSYIRRRSQCPTPISSRLYLQRAYNTGPPQDDRERAALMSFNRWWYETFIGPDPRLNRNYSGQLLSSVNKTFGYGRSDPRRIVRLEANLDFATFERGKLDRGDPPTRQSHWHGDHHGKRLLPPARRYD